MKIRKVNFISPKLLLTLPFILALSFLGSNAYADEYWRWKDENGVVHYGTAPPVGVDAERVTNYGNAEFAKDKAERKAKPPASDALIKLRKQRCDEEMQRLAYFGQSKIIRMKMPDGTTKTMTPEEIEAEKAISKKIMKENCEPLTP